VDVLWRVVDPVADVCDVSEATLFVAFGVFEATVVF
jgi:hypothetical protein